MQFLWLTVFFGLSLLSLGESELNPSNQKNDTSKNTSDLEFRGNVSVDKNWMITQGQILTLLNSIQNCKTLNATNFSILDYLKEYKNPDTIQTYIKGGFQDVEHLFEIFWYNWDNSELIYKTGVDLLQQGVNPIEFFYGFASVILNKPKGHRVPPGYDIFPDEILGPSEDVVGIEDITKDLSQKNSPGVDYYLEDPGLRSFYLSWFLHNPIWWKDKYNVTKNRTGELFLYVVHQLCARYNAARISESTLKELQEWKLRDDDPFVNEIDSKLREMVYRSGPQPNFGNPLDEVGTLILKLNPNGKSYFMELLNIAEKEWVMEKEWKTGAELNNLYSILKYVDTFTRGTQENLLQNRYTEADLHFDGVTLDSLKVIQTSRNKVEWKHNTFYTNWNYRTYYIKKCDKTVTIEKRILDHTEFFYELKIASLLENETFANVDIFLSTKFDFDGKSLVPSEYSKYMIHQDHFEIKLKTGENTFRRSSKHSSLSSQGDRSYLKLTQQLLDAEAGYIQLSLPNKTHTHCGIPVNLMVPKGGINYPRKFLLLALVTPTSTDNSEPFTFCEGGGGNSKAFGFPFDRELDPDNLLEELTNVKKIQIDGIHLEEDEHSEDL